jgi:methyltransferase family protein
VALRIEEILARIRREIAEQAEAGVDERPREDVESLPAIASRAELDYLNRNYALFDPASEMRSHRRLLGGVVLAFKRRFRNLVLGVLDRYFEKERLWLLELVRFQNALAERSDRLLRELTERTKAVAERNDLFLGVLDLRVENLEARDQVRRELAAPAPGALPAGPADELAAEMAAAFAGRVAERLRAFAGRLPNDGPILLLGCGAGDVADALGGATPRLVGVESSAALVAAARARGIAMEEALLGAYLESKPEASLAGVVVLRFSERHPRSAWPRLVAAAWRALRPAGVLIVEGIEDRGAADRLRWLLARQRFVIVDATDVAGADEGGRELVIVASKAESA